MAGYFLIRSYHLRRLLMSRQIGNIKLKIRLGFKTAETS